MLGSINFITKKKFDECLLSCLSNISFNIITCSATHLCTTQQKVNKLKFTCVPNSTCPITRHVNELSKKNVCVCLP